MNYQSKSASEHIQSAPPLPPADQTQPASMQSIHCTLEIADLSSLLPFLETESNGDIMVAIRQITG